MKLKSSHGLSSEAQMLPISKWGAFQQRSGTNCKLIDGAIVTGPNVLKMGAWRAYIHKHIVFLHSRPRPNTQFADG